MTNTNLMPLFLIVSIVCATIGGVVGFGLGFCIVTNEYQTKEYIKTGKLMLVADWTLDTTKELYDLDGNSIANVTFEGIIALTDLYVTSGDVFVMVFHWGSYHVQWITIEVPKVKLWEIEDEYIVTHFEVFP